MCDSAVLYQTAKYAFMASNSYKVALSQWKITPYSDFADRDDHDVVIIYWNIPRFIIWYHDRYRNGVPCVYALAL